MEKVGQVAVNGSEYEQVQEATKAMESAIYGALDAVDQYRELIDALREGQKANPEPNAALVKRYGQFLQRADAMTSTLEDDVLDELLFCLHRVFAVDLAERGEFI